MGARCGLRERSASLRLPPRRLCASRWALPPHAARPSSTSPIAWAATVWRAPTARSPRSDLAEKLCAGFQGTIVVPAGGGLADGWVVWRERRAAGLLRPGADGDSAQVGCDARGRARPALRAAACAPCRPEVQELRALPDRCQLAVRIEGLHLIGPKKFENRFVKTDPKIAGIFVCEDATAIRKLDSAQRRGGRAS